MKLSTYKTKDGALRKVYCCSKANSERMSRNGWWLELGELNESPQEIYDRLSQRYDVVRVYYSGTMIVGIHRHYAYCK